jgi:diaminohydroxyphosphoribosylaminopyrimidine deaminase/5-amino-6-(5-phosphoribosylamino)uracil reductase
MKRALLIARRGFGRVAPNPMVGAVIVKNGQIIGEGWHKKLGMPHAEPEALHNCSVSPEGATIYVTLEPCNHYGRTPPCTKAILNAGIKKVICAVRDPNPKAAGGLEYLSTQGVQCQTGLFESEARELNRIFFFANSCKSRPFIALKMALTLDGRIARADGSSKWISSLAARRYAHYLRSGYQAILAGNETIIQDDPMLDCRLAGSRPSPLRICLDARNRISPQKKLFRDGNVLYFSGQKRYDMPEHVQSCIFHGQSRKEQWEDFFSVLRKRDVHSLFVEGGAEIARFLYETGWIDYFYLFYGNCLFGADARPAFLSCRESRINFREIRKWRDSFLVEGCLQDVHRNN